MFRVRALFALLLLAVPLAAASGFPPPEGAQRTTLDGMGVATWVGTATEAVESAEANMTVDLWFAVEKNVNLTNESYRVYTFNVTSDALALSAADLTINVSYDPATSDVWRFANLTATLPASATGPIAYSYTVEGTSYDAEGNATALGSATGSYQLAIVVPQPPVEPAFPWLWVVAGLALLGVVIGGVVAKQRADRRRMNEAPRRSQVMREIELEKQLEKVEEKDPEQAQQIKQEIRAQEVVREKRRELQILEAKRADVLKTLDLLKKRHEAGGLTKLQYDNMVAKKQVDLQRIDADIAQMEAEGGGGSGAAA